MDYHRKVLKELRHEWNENIAKEFEHNFEEEFDLEVAIYVGLQCLVWFIIIISISIKF